MLLGSCTTTGMTVLSARARSTPEGVCAWHPALMDEDETVLLLDAMQEWLWLHPWHGWCCFGPEDVFSEQPCPSDLLRLSAL